jgi:hypothetical protein
MTTFSMIRPIFKLTHYKNVEFIAVIYNLLNAAMIHYFGVSVTKT